MKQLDVFRLAIKLLRRMSADKPNTVFKNSLGQQITIRGVADELERVTKWLYRDFYTEDIDLVVRCKKCKHYKKYSKKGLKKSSFWACELTKTQHESDYFCKDGEER